MESSSKKIKRKGILLKFRVPACTCMEISTWVFELIEKRKRNLRRSIHTHMRVGLKGGRSSSNEFFEEKGEGRKRMACFEELTKKEELERKDKIGR